MAISRPENPSLVIRALVIAGMREVGSRGAWKVLRRSDNPDIVIAVPTTQPLDPPKIRSYLEAADISEDQYLKALDEALKTPLE